MTLSSVIPRVVSVHDPAERAPSHEIERLAAALKSRPAAAAEQTYATRLLEGEVARQLGHESAILMPSGKTAQQIALRIHADRRPGRHVVLAHPRNHLTVWEDSNFASLHHLQVRPVGDPNTLMTAAGITAAISADDVSGLLWELPQRELGGELPEWHELQEQLSIADEAGVATHLDGARLWQTGPHFARPLADIARGFDTVYVSLYKDLGAPRGAVLAGNQQAIDTARRWRHRMGGTIDEAWPLALLALDGLDRVLPQMPRLVEHAQALAAQIQGTTPATIRPAIPHTAMFHVHLDIPAAAAARAHEQLRRLGRPGLTLRIRTSADPRHCYFETTVGPNALSITADVFAEHVRTLITLATHLDANPDDPNTVTRNASEENR